MLSFLLDKKKGEQFSVLCLGAHSDDIEIGCGGTMLHLIDANPGVSVHWVVLAGTGTRTSQDGVQIFLHLESNVVSAAGLARLGSD